MADYEKLIKYAKRTKRKQKRRTRFTLFILILIILNGLTGENNWIVQMKEARTAKREELSVNLVSEDLSDKQKLRISSIKASSTLTSSSGKSYPSWQLYDGDFETSWQEGEEDFGAGETLKIKLNKKEKVEYLVVYNGSFESEEKYLNNNRVKELIVTIDDEQAVVQLEDVKEPQVLTISGAGQIKEITLEVVSVYEGKEYNDTAITEIECY